MSDKLSAVDEWLEDREQGEQLRANSLTVLSAFDPGSGGWIAATLTGGFSGFGRDRGIAESMALSRAMLRFQMSRADGLTYDEWRQSVKDRESPALVWLLQAKQGE